MTRTVVCARCGQERTHFSRHLCSSCYRKVYRLGPQALERYPLMYAQRDEVLAFYAEHRSSMLQREIAEALGITPSALALHLQRGRDSGDTRAEPPEVPVVQGRRREARAQRLEEELARKGGT